MFDTTKFDCISKVFKIYLKVFIYIYESFLLIPLFWDTLYMESIMNILVHDCNYQEVFLSALACHTFNLLEGEGMSKRTQRITCLVSFFS